METEEQLQVSVTDLEEYAFCGLFYKFRRILEFPYIEQSSEEVYAAAMRSAFFSALRDFGLRKKTVVSAINDATYLFRSKFNEGSRNVTLNPERLTDLYAQGLIILSTLHQTLNVSKDVVAATSVPYKIELPEGIISDSLDALIVRDDSDHKTRSYVLLTAIDDQSFTATSDRLHDLHAGFAREVLLDQLNTNRQHPIEHQFFSLFGNMKPSVRRVWSQSRYFKTIASKLLSSMRSNIYLPTSAQSKCRSCWFQQICSNRFVEDNIPASAELDARVTLERSAARSKSQEA